MSRGSKGIPPTVNNFVAMLQSTLTQYDQKLSARERSPNIYRLGHLLGAAEQVVSDLAKAGLDGSEIMSDEIAEVMYKSLGRRFEPDFFPIKKVTKQIHEFLTKGKNPSLIRDAS